MVEQTVFLASAPLECRSGHEVGRTLLAELYQAHVGGEMPDIVCMPRGKPCFVNSPWHFSISHTRNHAFCALSQMNVGIDAEETDRRVNPALAEKILSPGELEQYQAADDPNRALLIFWVLKEAAAKLTGEGLRGYPNQTDFRLDDARITFRDGCVLAVLTKTC